MNNNEYYDEYESCEWAPVSKSMREWLKRNGFPGISSLSNTGAAVIHAAAATEGRADMIKLLLRMGVHVDSKDRIGKTPLGHACWAGARENAEILLAAGADFYIEDSRGFRPYDYAASSYLTGHPFPRKYSNARIGFLAKTIQRWELPTHFEYLN